MYKLPILNLKKKTSSEVAQIKSILSVFGINYKEIFEKHGRTKKG